MSTESWPDPFETLNAAFLTAYEAAVAATLARIRPILMVNRPKLVLLRSTGREERDVLPKLYNHLKAAAHVPLGIYAILAPFGEGFLAPERLAQLRQFRELTEQARTTFDPRDRSAAQRDPLEKLLTQGLGFMDEVLRSGRYVRDGLVRFLRDLRPSINAAIAAAVRLEIDAYHHQMRIWRREMSAEEWRRLRVVVVEAPQARRADLGLEYFARLLGAPVEGGRIIFAESLYLTEGEQWALDHIAKQELDTAVATAFFDDPGRLDRDILGDAAVAYLNTLSLE